MGTTNSKSQLIAILKEVNTYLVTETVIVCVLFGC